MIVGIGTDMVDVRRIAKVQQQFAERFVARVLVSSERTIWQTHAQPVSYLAKRWAAKEAVAKALGTGIGGVVGFHDIEITAAASGQPQVNLQGGAQSRLLDLGGQRCWLSLSDEGHFALAFVVLD
jgi:holo-[acyl-carrier protein] synthase